MFSSFTVPELSECSSLGVSIVSGHNVRMQWVTGIGRSIFTPETLKLIAEKSETDGPFVDQVLVQHDMLRADRRWSATGAAAG